MQYGLDQVLNQVLDRTDPDNPALRISGGAGGGGGGGGELPDLATAPVTVVTCNTSADPLFSGGANDARESCMFFNKSAERAYFGPSSSVTTTTYSFYLDQGQGMSLERGDGLARFDWHAVTSANSADICVTEGKA